MSSAYHPSGAKPSVPRLGPLQLGFRGDEVAGWRRSTRGRDIHFRVLRTLDDLGQAERLQEEVFGVTERDLIPANELIVVSETGGAVLAAFLPDDPQHAAGALLGWGGFVGRPRIVSDFLAVRREARNLGLAGELKRLQAAIALSRGFEEIVWTVDPLRAANARLNFGKLGAVASEYEIDRYGSTFATGLYGGMPSDRLHITWDIISPRVIARLLDRDEAESSPLTPDPSPPPFASGMSGDAALIAIPADIDALLTEQLADALEWRFRLREVLRQAFAEGFVIMGFRHAAAGANPAYILERLPEAKD